MNGYALGAGIAIAIFVVLRFRAGGLEQSAWAYPVLLATFPVYYWVFAGYGADPGILLLEVMTGMVFLLIAWGAYRMGGARALPLLAAGYIAHAIYDVYHDALFVNPGAPQWWPEFCGAVDAIIGIYLLFMALSIKQVPQCYDSGKTAPHKSSAVFPES